MIGYAPGGPADLQARALAEAAAPVLGQPLIVVSKTGATGTIMMSAVANSKNDGYTIGLTPGSLAISPYFMDVPYDLKKDFTYLAALSIFTEAFVVQADSPWKTLNDLISYARQNPDQVKVGAAEVASSVMFLAKTVGELAGVRWTAVPFKGDAAVVTALLGGHIHAAVNTGSHIPQVKAGKFRILANATPKRIPEFPDVPTLRELGFDLVSFTLTGIVGPKGLPEPIARKLVDGLNKARGSQAFQEILRKMELQPQFETGKDYEERIIQSYDTIGKFIKK